MRHEQYVATFVAGSDPFDDPPEGLERIRKAATKHRYYSKAATLERERGRMLMRELRRMCSDL